VQAADISAWIEARRASKGISGSSGIQVFSEFLRSHDEAISSAI